VASSQTGRTTELFVIPQGKALRAVLPDQVAKRSDSARCLSRANRVASGLKTLPPLPSESLTMVEVWLSDLVSRLSASSRSVPQVDIMISSVSARSVR
jgi:hypothetical protein